ncbi:MAG: type II toxin-antitoxin system VapC family toxin [Pseudomonadota bacterium]
MRILLDTHILIWLVTDLARVRPGERQLIQRHRSSVIVSVISLWEIRMKWDATNRKGKRKGDLDPAVAAAFVDDAGFAIEPLTRSAILAQLAIPLDHREAFDRLLLVHAQELGARLLTRDPELLVHPVAMSA